MALKMFQAWALAFKSKTELSFFVDVYNELKNSGMFTFSVTLECEADVEAYHSPHLLRRHPRIFSTLPQPLLGSTPTCACDVEQHSRLPTGNIIVGIVDWSSTRLVRARP